jgi:hypothetical protein
VEQKTNGGAQADAAEILMTPGQVELLGMYNREINELNLRAEHAKDLAAQKQVDFERWLQCIIRDHNSTGRYEIKGYPHGVVKLELMPVVPPQPAVQ